MGLPSGNHSLQNFRNSFISASLSQVGSPASRPWRRSPRSSCGTPFWLRYLWVALLVGVPSAFMIASTLVAAQRLMRYTRLAVPLNSAVLSSAEAPAARRLKAFHSVA